MTSSDGTTPRPKKGLLMSKRSKRSLAGLAILVVAAAVAVVATATAASEHHGVKLHRVATHVAPRLGQVFAVLHNGSLSAHSAVVGASQSLPPNVQVGMSSLPGREVGSAVFTGGTYPTWVVPGSTEVCLVIGAIGQRGVPGSTCASVSDAEAGLILVTETDSGQPLVLGLAPNGNASVKVTYADRTTARVPVRNNVYEITSGKPSTVTLTTASGAPITRSVALSPPPPPSAPAGSTTP